MFLDSTTPCTLMSASPIPPRMCPSTVLQPTPIVPASLQVAFMLCLANSLSLLVAIHAPRSGRPNTTNIKSGSYPRRPHAVASFEARAGLIYSVIFRVRSCTYLLEPLQSPPSFSWPLYCKMCSMSCSLSVGSGSPSDLLPSIDWDLEALPSNLASTVLPADVCSVV